MSGSTQIHTIPERFSFDEDISLKVFLRENQGQDIAICARNIRRVDSLLIQYLLSASRAWRAAGKSFCLTDVTPEIGKSLALMGLDDQTLCWKVTA